VYSLLQQQQLQYQKMLLLQQLQQLQLLQGGGEA